MTPRFHFLLLVMLLFAGRDVAVARDGEAGWVQGGDYRLFARTFPATAATESPLLLVVLHGDSPFKPPEYQYAFAAKAAAAHPHVAVVALLRPGYADPQGNRSEGERGLTNGDNWNAHNSDALAAAIDELRKRHKARKVVVVGHSGGAALTGNVLARHPGLIDAALLVACPCGDLAEWRESMRKLTGAPVFEGEIESLSPIMSVNTVADDARMVMLVGSEDVVTPPRFSEQYHEAARKAGKRVSLIQVRGQPHDMLFDESVFTALADILAGTASK